MKSGSVYFFRCLSFLVGVTAFAMLFPLALAVVFGERNMIFAFSVPSGFALGVILPVIFLTGKNKAGIETSRGLLLVCLTWFLSCLLGAFPFYFSGFHVKSFTDAFFESASGFTTTGATIFADVEALPRSLLFWRSMTQWLGGMSMVVLMAVLAPLLGTKGFLLFGAETPDKGRINLRITAAARVLLSIYASLTVLETLLLTIGGMNWFDALTHTFSTVSTGGFSSRNGSIAAYHSPRIEWVCIVFMIIAGFNFSLIYKLFQGKGREILKNSEAQVYFAVILIAGTICTCALFPLFRDEGLEQSIRSSLFQSVSILTTTGFSVTDHRQWHPLAQGVLFFLMFAGACSSSTGSGIKVMRHVILFKQSRNELMKILYPSGVFSIHIDGKEGQKNVVHGVAGFFFLYWVLVVIAALFVSFAGTDVFSSLNIGLLMAGNIGLGIVRGSLQNILFNLPAYSKLALSLIMIAGRLELWTIFALFNWGRD
jgi:trk system potassium uptake protein TrkH